MYIQIPKYNWRYYAHGSISLCMIMKNEARRLPRCLNSVRGLVNEVIIVDTGSTDDSIAIAKSFGCRVLRDPWQNDFARPRNISIDNATSLWILIMDPDEVILKKDHLQIKELTRSMKFVAYQMTTFNYGRNPKELNYRTLLKGLDPKGEFKGFVPSTKTRLFKNGLGIHFEGCWHELADWYIIRNKLPYARANIPIHHWSEEMTHSSPKEKTAFYLTLGEKKVKEWPRNGQAWWELAVAESIAGLRYRAAQSINKALSLGFSSSNVLSTLARIYRMTNNEKKATLAFEKAICKIYPNLTHIEANLKPLESLIR
jgi:glycosyltransferase involved in cell wall biosynthesis